MGKIIILDENTANKIAAGEVIERPASVIKELVENSIDAGATSVSVEIRNGGISFIRVTDNGSGFAEDDVEIAFERHSTSKIRRADDLENLTSMGFRGEALASIAAVSSVQLLTRTKEAIQGISIEVKGGSVIGIKPAGCPAGTSITVRELFFNTPARYKFLKKDTTEAGHVADVLSRIALGYPDISFKMTSSGSLLLQTPGNGDLKSAIFSVYGAETAKQLLEVDYDDGRVKIAGYVSKAELSRSNRNQQSIYINRRIIRSKTITSAIDAAYATFLMKNRFAFVLLNININPALVDVNVHPSKMEVKFSNEQDIYRAVYHAVNGTLLNKSEIRTLPGYDMPDKNAYNFVDKTAFKTTYAQQTMELSSDKPSSGTSAGTSCRQDRSAYSQSNRIHSNDGQESAAPSYTGSGRIHSGNSPALAATTHSAGGFVFSRGSTGLKQDFEPIRKELEKKRADAVTGSGQKESISEEGMEYKGAQDVPETKDEVPGLFAGARIIGQAFSTYILLEHGDELLLLDQHAAHERIRYEELKNAYKKNEPLQQTLLSVISIELTGGEYRFAVDEAGFFKSLGFTYESFGTNSIILRTVPFDDNGIGIRDMFLEILGFAMNENSQHRDVIADEALYRMACKSAIKANKKLDEREIEALLRRLEALENPFTCPHGRPAILKIRRYELEKLFKRIV